MSVVARRYFVRALERWQAGDEAGACQEFGAAVELAPIFWEARIGYSMTLATGDPPRAAQALRRGLSLGARGQGRRQLCVALGDVLVAAGDYPGAEEAYREAATISGPPLDAQLGRLAARKREYTTAFAKFASLTERR